MHAAWMPLPIRCRMLLAPHAHSLGRGQPLPKHCAQTAGTTETGKPYEPRKRSGGYVPRGALGKRPSASAFATTNALSSSERSTQASASCAALPVAILGRGSAMGHAAPSLFRSDLLSARCGSPQREKG